MKEKFGFTNKIALARKNNILNIKIINVTNENRIIIDRHAVY